MDLRAGVKLAIAWMHDLRLAVPSALKRSKRRISVCDCSSTAAYGRARSARQSCQDRFITYPEDDSFRCSRTFPGSGKPPGFLRALDGGGGGVLHRRARPQHADVLVHQLGLHGRHRKLCAQYRRQSRRRAQLHDKHSSDVTLGLCESRQQQQTDRAHALISCHETS